MESNVYDYILGEESRFKIERVPVGEGWDWNMAEHIKRCTLMKNSRFEKGNFGDKPFKNIIRPILNVAYRSEGFDVKDIEPFVDSSENHYKSFLTRKYNARFCRKHDIDTFIDEDLESYVDYGLAVSKKSGSIAPQHVPLQRIAFCDQTSFLKGPACEKHAMSIDELLDMVETGGWYADQVERAIVMAQSEKTNAQAHDQKQKTPGKYIEVYELHGILPKNWLKSDEAEGGDQKRKYQRQMHIVCYYKDSSGNKQGITLFSGPEKENCYKALVRDGIYGRACGFSAIEELFEPQVWINYDAIQIKEMLDVATMMIIATSDKSFATRNPKITDMEKGQIVYNEGPINQVNTTPVNMALFERNAQDWQQLAQTTGSANEGLLGKNPSSGTPFALQEEINIQGMGLHEWRQGKLAAHHAIIYRDWILESLVKEMNGGKDFSETLTLEELNEIVDAVATNEANRRVEEIILSNGMLTPQEQQIIIQQEKDAFMKAGSRRFMSVLMGELKGLPMDVFINIKNKQKDLGRVTTVLTNVFRQVISNPDVLRNPAVAKIFNRVLESSGESAIDFASLTRNAPSSQPSQAQAEQVPESTAAPAPMAA